MRTVHKSCDRLSAMALIAVIFLANPSFAIACSLPDAYGAISGSHAAIWVAKTAGYFDKHGIATDLIYLGGEQATKVLVSGSAPFI